MLVKNWFCPNCEHQFWVSPSLDSTCSLLSRPLVWMVHGLIQWSVDLFIWQYALKGLPFRGKIISNSEQRFLCSRHIHQRLDYPVCSTPGRANDFHFWALWLQGRSDRCAKISMAWTQWRAWREAGGKGATILVGALYISELTTESWKCQLLIWGIVHLGLVPIGSC